MTGASDAAVGDERVTDARRRVGLPQEGQNFFELSLQILGQYQIGFSDRIEFPTDLKQA